MSCLSKPEIQPTTLCFLSLKHGLFYAWFLLVLGDKMAILGSKLTY